MTGWIFTLPDHRYVEVDAPTRQIAVGALQQTYPGTDFHTITERTVRAVLETVYGGATWPNWINLISHRDGDWLVLDFATPVSLSGEVDPKRLANYRHLRGIWADHPGVRFGNGVSVLLDHLAPPQFSTICDSQISFPGDPLHHGIYTQVCTELGLHDRRVRVAYRHCERWIIATCPAAVLGNPVAEASAVPGLGPDHNLVVVDQVPGFPAGCSTWSLHDAADDAEEARRDHIGCAHLPFRPA
ncbi:hypothetical protein [Nocardia thailandica]